MSQTNAFSLDAYAFNLRILCLHKKLENQLKGMDTSAIAVL
jgi:hypothetical protein